MVGDGYSADTAFEWPNGKTRVVGNTAVRENGFPAMGVDWWRVRLRAGRSYRVQMRRPSFGLENGSYRYLWLYDSLSNAQSNNYYTYSYRYGVDGTYFPSIEWTPSGTGVMDWWVKVDDGNSGFNGYRGEYTLDFVPAPVATPSVFVTGAVFRHCASRPGEAALLFPQVNPGGMTTGLRSTPWDYSWNSVCWSPELGLFCAVQNSTSNNNVMTSPDGITWTGRSSGGSARFNAVAWSPALQRFVAFDCYYNYYVYTSADGITWSASGVDYGGLYVTSICWSPELARFVAVPQSSYSYALTSENATNWTPCSFPAQNAWQSVCWSPSLELFVAVGQSGSGNRVMTSPDGITWTLRASAADYAWRGVCWSPETGLFVAVASSGTGNRVMTSPDGIAWTLQATPADHNWRSVCWANEPGLFFAVAESGTANRAMTSPDGIHWTLFDIPADNNWASVCWSPQRRTFAAVASTGSGNRAFSTTYTPRVDHGFHAVLRDGDRSGSADQNMRGRSFAPVKPLGVQATRASKREALVPVSIRPRHGIGRERVETMLFASPRPESLTTTAHACPNYSWLNVCWSPDLGLFVAVARNGRVMTSSDGETWTERASTSSYYAGIAWSPELSLFAAVSYGGYAMTSPDGFSWTSRSNPGYAWHGLCWSPELRLFVATCYDSNVAMTSPDGITWTYRSTPNRADRVCWSAELGICVAVSRYGTVMTSPDGSNWTARTPSDGNGWMGVCWAARLGLFVAVAWSGNGNRVMTSPDGITWTARTAPTNPWVNVCWSPERKVFLAVANNEQSVSLSDKYLMTSPDGFNWTAHSTDNYWYGAAWSSTLSRFAAVTETNSNRALTVNVIDADPGGMNRIHGLLRADHTADHALEAGGGATATHGAGWRVIDGVFTQHAAARHAILYPKRHRLFARDTATGVEHDLGVAEENNDAPGIFTLADVPLADGTYEVEARSTDALWADARSRQVFTFRLRSGEDPAVELPAVVNLQAALTSNWWRVLSWSVVGDSGEAAFSFGVWFGDTEAVDLSDPPTAIFARARGLDHYEHHFLQSSPQYAAVAAFTPDGARGKAATLFLPWDDARLTSPPHQWAEMSPSNEK